MARWACVVVIASGCYRAPLPPCGFICGESSACPDGYTCNADNRCHLDDTSVACEGAVDAGVAVVPPPPPTHISFAPARGASGVKTTDYVTVIFDVPVQNVNSSTFQLRSGGIPIDGIMNFEEGTIAGIAPFHLPSDAIVEGSLDPSITTVDKGRSIGLQLWSFATEIDTTPPMVTAFEPGNGATGMSLLTSVGFNFDEDIANPSSIRITGNGVPIPGTWDRENGLGTHASFFEPTGFQLPANATIDVSVMAPVCDYAGNPIVPFEAEFTTGPDDVSPMLIASVPEQFAIDVPTDIVIVLTFNEPVTIAEPVLFYVNQSYELSPSTEVANGATVTITAALPPAASITLFTFGITDLAGNASVSDLRFTTK